MNGLCPICITLCSHHLVIVIGRAWDTPSWVCESLFALCGRKVGRKAMVKSTIGKKGQVCLRMMVC